MQIAIYGKGMDITDALRAYVERRLTKLDRYFPGESMAAQVALGIQRQRQIVEVTLPLEGGLVRAEEAAPSMYAAVDLVLDKLERQIHKYKTRLVRKPRQGQAAAHPALAAPEESEAGQPDGDPAAGAADQVLRHKTFLFKPMSLEEAILQMDLLGHDFFVFRDGSGGGVQLLYRRRSGGLGLIAER